MNSNYRDASSLAAFKKRMDTSRQQSSANGTSLPPDESAATRTMDQAMNPSPTTGLGAPEPREIIESPDPRYLDLEDDFTYVNNDEELDLGQDHEGDVMASTSPSASARINRVSHNPNRYFDTPEDLSSRRRSVEGSSGADGTSNAARRFFNEKQTNAAKVSPISYADTQSAERRRDMPLDVNFKKRPNPFNHPSNDSDNESDDFERDSRHASRRPEKRQRLQGSARVQSARQQLQTSLNEAGQTGQGLSNSTQMSRVHYQDDSEDITDGETTNRQPHRTPQASSPPPSAPAPGSHWAKVNARATAANGKGRKPNHRWNDAEDERLLLLMGKFGTSYSQIKKEDNAVPASEGGPLLDRRTQVQCKDRARNLKRKYQR
jgi:hypothetical protein